MSEETNACEVCGKKAIRDGIALFRLNVGELPSRWRCKEHFGQPIDAGVLGITDAIEADNRGERS